MKIWYDALTGKHVRYGIAIGKCLKSEDHDLILTTRNHPDTLPLAEFLGQKFIVTGRYDPKSLLTRLKSGLERQLLFSKIFEKTGIDLSISHGSADLCRVAFGLGKPIISTFDTPYAVAVNKLTLPLSDYIVVSKAIPKESFEKYVVDGEIRSFNGVDEVAWVRDAKPTQMYDFKKPIIVIRELEKKAVYSKRIIAMKTLAKKLTRLGTVIFLSRYQRKGIKGLVVPEGFIDSVSLVAQADLFIGVGGTITREAALQGTPAITVDVFQNQNVNDFLAEKNFPIFKAQIATVPKLAEKLLGRKYEVAPLLKKLENPVNVIAELVKKIGENRID